MSLVSTVLGTAAESRELRAIAREIEKSESERRTWKFDEAATMSSRAEVGYKGTILGGAPRPRYRPQVPSAAALTGDRRLSVAANHR